MATKHEYPPEFEAAWAAYPRKKGASKFDAFRAWRSRIREGVDAETIVAGVRAYALYVEAKGTSQEYMKLPETFFGPGRHFENDWTVEPEAQRDPRRGPLTPHEELLDFYGKEPLV